MIYVQQYTGGRKEVTVEAYGGHCASAVSFMPHEWGDRNLFESRMDCLYSNLGEYMCEREYPED